MRKWRTKNRDKFEKWNKEYKSKNKERIKKVGHEYYLKNKKEKMAYQKAYSKKHRDILSKKQNEYYHENKKRLLGATKITRKNNKTRAILSKGGKCQDCGIILNDKNSCIFTFHHENPNIKEFELSKIMVWKYETVMKEIKKTILLCFNCHMLRHHGGKE